MLHGSSNERAKMRSAALRLHDLDPDHRPAAPVSAATRVRRGDAGLSNSRVRNTDRKGDPREASFVEPRDHTKRDGVQLILPKCKLDHERF